MPAAFTPTSNTVEGYGAGLCQAFGYPEGSKKAEIAAVVAEAGVYVVGRHSIRELSETVPTSAAGDAARRRRFRSALHNKVRAEATHRLRLYGLWGWVAWFIVGPLVEALIHYWFRAPETVFSLRRETDPSVTKTL
jgi:hypothetical protein